MGEKTEAQKVSVFISSYKWNKNAQCKEKYLDTRRRISYNNGAQL